MPEGGSFVQFTYGPAVPVADEVMRRLGLRARRHGFTLWNLPPASVYVFTRDRASVIRSIRSMRRGPEGPAR
jgi:phospholipid N-methyltransferase